MPLQLNSAGTKFFDTSFPSSTGQLKIHEFHEVEVKTPGPSFTPLASDNQILLNKSNTILTLQGHPEMDAQLSKMLLAETPQYAGKDDVERRETERRIELEHDGGLTWRRIVEWAREE